MSKKHYAPRILSVTPELIWDLNELDVESGLESVMGKGINFSTGGLAPIPSTQLRALTKMGIFDMYAVIPKLESSLRNFNFLTTREIRNIEKLMPENLKFVSHPSFNKVQVVGTNTKIYDASWRFSSIDRAIAFSAGVINYYLSTINPDIVWVHDWMGAPVATVAKARGIKVAYTCHNPIFTQLAHVDELIHKGIDLRDYDDVKPSMWMYLSKDNSDNIYKYDFAASGINCSDDFMTVSPSVLERMLNTDYFDKFAPSVMDALRKKANSTHLGGRSRVHGLINPLIKDESDFLKMIEKDGLENTIMYRKNEAKKLRHITGLKEGGSLLVYTNRLSSSQKNPELMINNAIYLANKYDARVLILANGDQHHVDNSKRISFQSNGLVAYFPFNAHTEEQAKKTDNTYGVQTPWFEPCGGQNVNYPVEGILCISHAVDGIKDTVHALDVSNSKGNGFPYEVNDDLGLEYGVAQMNKFSKLPDNIRYEQLIRIAKEQINLYSSSAHAENLVNNVFMPLLREP